MVKNSPSQLLDYLPAIYQSDPFIGQFLLAFERVLLGRPSDEINLTPPGLEERIANIANLFDPKNTPDEFLYWLAGWTAFSLRADLTPEQQQDFIAEIIPLYRRRGTRGNLQKLLKIFIKGIPKVIENNTGTSQSERPHFFRVIVSLTRVSPRVLARQLEITKALIELEKPAHTDYELQYIFPSMQINVYSTIGVDTILGSATDVQPIQNPDNLGEPINVNPIINVDTRLENATDVQPIPNIDNLGEPININPTIEADTRLESAIDVQSIPNIDNLGEPINVNPTIEADTRLESAIDVQSMPTQDNILEEQ
jgi:phage tail-like protein